MISKIVSAETEKVMPKINRFRKPRIRVAPRRMRFPQEWRKKIELNEEQIQRMMWLIEKQNSLIAELSVLVNRIALLLIILLLYNIVRLFMR
jgi:hypothetical protein